MFVGNPPGAHTKEKAMEILKQHWSVGGLKTRPTFDTFDSEGRMLNGSETVGSCFVVQGECFARDEEKVRTELRELGVFVFEVWLL
jgi:hypothetical protein